MGNTTCFRLQISPKNRVPGSSSYFWGEVLPLHWSQEKVLVVSSDLDVEHGDTQLSGERSTTSPPSSTKIVMETMSALRGPRSLAGSVSSHIEPNVSSGTADNSVCLPRKAMGPLRGEAQRQFVAASALALLEAQWSKTCSQLGWSRFLSLDLIWI